VLGDEYKRQQYDSLVSFLSYRRTTIIVEGFSNNNMASDIIMKERLQRLSELGIAFTGFRRRSKRDCGRRKGWCRWQRGQD